MKYALLLCTGMLLWLTAAHAQKPYIIAGFISDEKGLPLSGASVVVSPGEQGMVAPGNLQEVSHDVFGDQGVVTGSDGRYIISGLQPGDYILKVSFVGYETSIDTLVLSQNLTRDIQLTPEVQSLLEVVITGQYAEIRSREEPLNIEVVNDAFLKQHLGGSLMHSLDRLPGVDAMGIGSSQSKPVIRGLSFNRVVVVENGIKHEGQQWGIDHGLEVDQYAAERVEVIKGPSSLMHGSDALGGVIILSPAGVPERNSWGGSLDLTGKTNNELLGSSFNLYGRKEKLYASLRATLTEYGDYRVPVDSVDIYSFRAPLYENRLRNTAGREQVLHLETGWVNNGFSSRFFISHLQGRNGFFANAHGLEPRMVDSEMHDRSSRDILYPYHQVQHTKFINRTTWRKENHTLRAELGYQRNFRQEVSNYVNHGYMPPVFPDTLPFASDIERQFDKDTWSLNLRSTAQISWNMEIISGIQADYQDNDIDGRGFIIPAFSQFRSGAFLLLKQGLGENSLLSGGLRYDYGQLTIESYNDWFPSPETEGSDTTWNFLGRATEMDRSFSSLTWSVGYNLNLDHFSFKANAGKSFRMPLAKELAANGVNYHRFSYEVGNPSLKAETSYQLDAGMEWHTRKFAVGLSPFIGYFPNYIYLNPGFEHDRLYGNGNQVFNYTQSEVIRYGGEIHAHYHPLKSLKAGLIGEYIFAQQLSGEKEGFSLPFSPPASLLLHLKYIKDELWRFNDLYASVDFRLVAAQDRIVPPEEPTPGYQVVHLGLGGDLNIRGQAVSMNLQVQNLLNQTYFEHTSYYRLINVPAAGRNLVLNIRIPFSGQLKNQK